MKKVPLTAFAAAGALAIGAVAVRPQLTHAGGVSKNVDARRVAAQNALLARNGVAMRLWTRDGSLDRAEAILREVYRSGAGDGSELALLLCARGKLVESREILARILHSDPTRYATTLRHDELVLMLYAALSQSLGDFAEADWVARAAGYPRNAEGYLAAATAVEKNGGYLVAMDLCDLGSSLYPDARQRFTSARRVAENMLEVDRRVFG